jgi:AcrR family transcriptional regulator
MRSTAAIVEAAMARFARDGFATPLRAIAEDAGVSAALIVHHFGSKAGLRAAVDTHVLDLVDEKMRLLQEEGAAAAMAWVMTVMTQGDVPRYLARVLVEGGTAGDALFRSFVDTTEKVLLDLDVADPRMTASLLVTHSLGLMVMASQVSAATGVDALGPEGLQRIVMSALSIYRGALQPLLP